MKKPGPTKTRGAKAPQSHKGGLLDVDDALLSEMLADLLAGKGFGPPPPGLTELFERIVAACAEGRLLGDKDLIFDWISELQEARIAANGGDVEARAALGEIDALLRQALEGGRLGPADMVVLGKTFADADLPPPAPLKAAIAPFFSAADASAGAGVFAEAWAKTLRFDGDAFDIHTELRAVTHILPASAKIAMLAELAGDPRAAQAVAGFLFDPESEVAAATGPILAEAAKRAPVESAAMERLALVRPWLPPQRQASVDEALAAMRRHVLAPQAQQPTKLLKCLMSVCDGSGALQAFAAQKSGKLYRIAAIMIKPQGVADAFLIDATAKRDVDNMLTAMSNTLTSVEVDLPTLARVLRLALADNLASGQLPPFKTAQVVEALGLGLVPPQAWSPEDLCRSLLDEVAQDRKDPAAAHAAVVGHEVTETWFEAGEEVATLLAPLRGKQKRVKALLESHLPGRRAFWARQCALSALALSCGRNRVDKLWPSLALVGADLAAGRPLADIPLMKKIAETSVKALQAK